MDNHVKTVLKAVVDDNSLSEAKKQITKERLKIPVDIQISNLSQIKSDLEKHLFSLGKLLRSLDISPYIEQGIPSILEMKDAIGGCLSALEGLTKYANSTNEVARYFDDAARSAEKLTATADLSAQKLLNFTVDTSPLKEAEDFGENISKIFKSIGTDFLKSSIGTINTDSIKNLDFPVRKVEGYLKVS